MERDSIKHSAEGTHWQKKNHKYIRKEGNRYIYKEDSRKVGSNKNRTARDILSEKGVRNVGYEDIQNHYAPSNSLEPTTTRYRNTVTKDKNGDYRETSQYKGYRGTVESINMPFDVNYKYEDEIKANKRKQRQAENRSNSGSGRPDYKQLSKQHSTQQANRKAAANGMIVNPTRTWKGSDGKVVNREDSNRNYATPTTADYKKAGQLRGGKSKRYNTVSNQGSTDYKELSKQQAQKTNRANAANGARGTFEKGHMSDQDYQKKYAKSQSDAGKRKRAAGVHSNFDQQYAKSTAQYGPESAKRKLAQKNRKKRLNEQGSLNNYNVTDQIPSNTAKEWSKETSDAFKRFANMIDKKGRPHSTSAQYKVANQNIIKNSSKKLKENGYFTVQNGKTVFVPSDKITMKKVSKGRQVIDKIFNKFFKKK